MSNNIDKTEDELKEFAKLENKVVSSSLKDLIKDIAKTGRYRYSWDLLKPLISVELKQAMDNFLEQFPPKKGGDTDAEKVKELENLKEEILKTLHGFESAPFTIQRLTELITQPRQHYKTCAKYYRGVLKNILVVSTVDPEQTDELPAKKIRLEVNGDASLHGYNLPSGSWSPEHRDGHATLKETNSVTGVCYSTVEENGSCKDEADAEERNSATTENDNQPKTEENKEESKASAQPKASEDPVPTNESERIEKSNDAATKEESSENKNSGEPETTNAEVDSEPIVTEKTEPEAMDES
eukprot:gene6142-6848_t